MSANANMARRARTRDDATDQAVDQAVDQAGASQPLDPEPPSLLEVAPLASTRLELDITFDTDNDDDPLVHRWQALGDLDALIVACRDGLLAQALDGLRTPAEATIALSCDAAVQRLNRTYRGKDKPTNVLSFPAPAMPVLLSPVGADEMHALGDIILAFETVQREADEQDIPVAHHMQHLVVHGVLHLLGYDHETDVEAQIMEGLETEILGRLGIADPYAPLPD
jgi:probable rRNA maturation factor